ncbi:MAG TPA: hypothetical protein VFM14_12560 [Gemmatimonadales bacterium]|nr:hypothetical protein [Gemmatimonadales bacterium]
MRSLRSAIAVLALACGDEPGPIVNTARLTIEISGLPAGVDAQVQVDGPGNYGQLVPETRTFSELAPGTYVITASQVITGTGTYTPVPSTQTVNLVTDAEETASVVYSP